MPLITQKWITRDDLRNNPNKFYVFGDNDYRKGLGGQAKEMRGEPNAIGVVTKWRPDMDERSFFNDGPEALAKVNRDLVVVEFCLKGGHTVVVPEDGIGTGLSQLPIRAPKLDAYIKAEFKRMEVAYANTGIAA